MAEIPKSIRASLYIDGKPAEGSLKSLEQATQRLNRELKGLVVGTDSWNKKMKELQDHKKALADINGEINKTNGLFGFLKSEVGKMGVLAAGFLGFQFVVDQITSIVTGNAKLSDSFADVRKTTGLSEEGIRRLNSELSKIDTRTAKTDLLGLAEVAGKLGIAGERELLGFVKAADQIGVALGKDLGDVEQAVNSLGKITELFGVKQELGIEDALIRTGSAINALGAAGTASEAYIVNFTRRLGPIAPAANISMQNVLGLATTMDELGQTAESSTTAISQFLIGIGQDVPKFAKIAGMSTKAFADLLQKDGNQAFIAVLKNIKSTGGGLQGLAKSMGLIGEDGAKAVSALGALSNKIGLLEERQKLANDEFTKGTSLTNEFNIKNETFGAVLERVGKEFRKLTSNTVIIDFLKNMVFGFSNLLKWLQANSVLIVNMTKFLMIGVTAWAAYRLATFLSATAMELFAARTALARAATLAFAGVQALLTGNLGRAAAAMRLLNIAMASNPFGAIAAGILALVTGMALFSSTTTAAAKTQQAFNDLEAESKKLQNDEITRLKILTDIIKDDTKSRGFKLEAVKALRSIMPDVLKDLTDEEVLTKKGEKAIRDYIAALEDKTMAEAAQASIKKLQEENIMLENQKPDNTSFFQKTRSMARASLDAMGNPLLKNKSYGEVTQELYAKQQAPKIDQVNKGKIEENTSTIKAIQEKYGSKIVKNIINENKTPTENGDEENDENDDKKGKGGKSKKQIAKEKEKAAILKIIGEIRKAEEKAFADRLTEYDAEIYANSQKYEALRNEAKENITDKTLLSETLIRISNAEYAEYENIIGKFDKIEKEKLAETKKRSAEAFAEFTQTLENFSEESYQATLNNEQKEILAIDQFYETTFQKLYKSLQDGYLTKLQFAKMELELQKATEKEKQKIWDDYASGKKKNAPKPGDENKFAGMTKDQKGDFAIEQAMLVEQTISNIMADARKHRLEAKLTAIEKERDAELANGELTEHQKNAIRDKYEQKAKREKLKAWQADKRASIASAVIAGALAVIKAMPNVPLAVASGIAATAAVAAIVATKPPAFAKGGFSDTDPEGFVSRDTTFKKSASGRPFRAGEAGREWIAPNWMLKNPRTANIIGMLETARRERSFAMGGYNAPAPIINTPQTNVTVDLQPLLSEMKQNTKAVSQLKLNLNYKLIEEMQENIELQRKETTW